MKSPGQKLPVTQVQYEFSPLAWKYWLPVGVLFGLGIAALFLIPFGQSHGLSDRLFVPEAQYADDGVRNYILSTSTECHEADVVILGTSSAREAFESSALLSQKYEETFSKKLSFIEIASESQTLFEYLFYANEMKVRSGQLYVITLSPSAFYRAPTISRRRLFNGYYPLETIGNLEKLSKHFPEISGWFSRSSQFSLVRKTLFRTVHFGLKSWSYENIYNWTPPYRKYRFGKWPVGDLEFIDRSRQRRRSAMAGHYGPNKDFNLQVLNLLVRRIKEAGGIPIIFEQPSIDDESAFDKWQKDYDSKIATLVDTEKVTYVNLNKTTNLGPDCFYDVAHVSPKGRERWSAAFLTWLNGNFRSQPEK